MHHSLWKFLRFVRFGRVSSANSPKERKEYTATDTARVSECAPTSRLGSDFHHRHATTFFIPLRTRPSAAPTLTTHTHTITPARERNSLVLREDGPSNNRPPFPVQPNQTHTTLVSLSRYTLLSIALKKSLLPSSRLVTYLSLVSSSAVRPLRNRAQQYGGFFSPPSKRRRILVRRVLDQLSTRIMLSLHQLPKEETASR